MTARETVLVTGAGGFVGLWVGAACLEAGLAVRAAVRAPTRAALRRREVALRAELARAGAEDAQLSVCAADLTEDAGWADAVDGCRFIAHVASPFPLRQSGRADALIATAVGGARRVVAAGLAAGVERIALTSSVAAMMYRPARPARFVFGEADWTDPDWPAVSPYMRSKTLAERAAWQLAQEAGARDRLVTVNPGLVLGPLVSERLSASTELVRLIMSGRVPAVPPTHVPVVDVRDVAQLHVAALMNPDCGGRRLVSVGSTMAVPAFGTHLRQAFPDKAARATVRVLPAGLVRAGGVFDAGLKSVSADLGITPIADTAYVEALTGLVARPAHEALTATGQSLIDLGVV